MTKGKLSISSLAASTADRKTLRAENLRQKPDIKLMTRLSSYAYMYL